ncbi:MAG: HAMP domain-containing sensor histidine kinase, partial [Acidobacteriota bacterium]
FLEGEEDTEDLGLGDGRQRPELSEFEDGASSSRGASGDWRCVARETIFDDQMEALMRSSVEVEDPAKMAGPLWLAAGLWALVSLGLVFLGSYRLALGPVSLAADLSRLNRRLRDGETLARLTRRNPDGDLDAARLSINATLESLDDTIATLSDVADHIAHDLRTPLTRLRGQLDLVGRSEAPTPAMMSAVQEEADQLLETFNALLRIARVKSGSKRKGFKVFDLGAVVGDAADLYAPAMAEKKLAFDCRVTPSPLEVEGDPDLWMQAASNLLDNALKYNPPSSRVSIELEPTRAPDRPGARLEVRDTGPGIPEDEIDKVFERFYRLRSHRDQRGSGLGLSLVAAICELHGASIEVDGEGGLTLSLWIPARQRQPGFEGGSASARGGSAGGP